MATGLTWVINAFMIVWILLTGWAIVSPKSFWNKVLGRMVAVEPKGAFFAMMRIVAAFLLVGGVSLWNRL
ncbi:hypothetical protein B9G55_18960 [Saccharibacillus sp. O16]|nr:hypothetical protein B9G55_18960 [Saccharibacillus sp. O16]